MYSCETPKFGCKFCVHSVIFKWGFLFKEYFFFQDTYDRNRVLSELPTRKKVSRYKYFVSNESKDES